jgi:hypothetical protein
MPSLPRSRRFSSPGNSPSTWRRHAKPSRLIPTSTREKTPNTSRWNDKTISAAPPPICCWSSVPRSGYWRTGTGSAQSTWGGEPRKSSTDSTYTAVAFFAICCIVSWDGSQDHERNTVITSDDTTTCWNCTVPDSLPRMGRTRPRKLRDRIILVAGQLPRGDGGDGPRNPSSPSLALC